MPKNSKLTSVIILIVCTTIFIAQPLHQAKAVVLVMDEVAHEILLAIQSTGVDIAFNTKVTAFNTGISAGEDKLMGWKEFIADPAAWIAKFLIRQLHTMIVQWIATGQFGLPRFVLDYMLDPARLAENAARMFLTYLTNINFCQNARINIPKSLTIKASFYLNTRCTLPSSWTDIVSASFKAPQVFTPYVRAQQELINNDPLWNAYFARAKQMEAEQRAIGARRDEALASGGFLGDKDSKGRIKTPGRAVADYLKSSMESEFRSSDIADELGELIADVIDTLITKVVNLGLAELSNVSQSWPALQPFTGTVSYQMAPVTLSGSAPTVTQSTTTFVRCVGPACTPPLPYCGNSIIEGTEQCDYGPQNGVCPLICSTSCTINSCTGTTPPPAPGPVCGNGIPEPGEACDLGPSNGACPSLCSTSCTVNTCGGGACGDGFVDPGESCDLGASNGPCPSLCSLSCRINTCF